MKNFGHFFAVVIAGAVMGTFLGKLLAMWFPSGSIHNLFATELNAGLHPFTLNLGVLDFTLGCLFNINIASILGIIIAAAIYKQIIK